MHNALKNNIPACKLVMPNCKPTVHDLLSFCDKTGLSYHHFTAWECQSEETMFVSTQLSTWTHETLCIGRLLRKIQIQSV